MNGIIVDEKIMEKTTFNGVCQLLKGRKDEGMLSQCVVPLAKLLTLVVPGLTFARPANLEWFGDILDRGQTILDSAEPFWGIIKHLGNVLCKNESDYTKRANNAAMAYVLIVYTAFFDAAKEVLDTGGEKLDGYAKTTIVRKAWAASVKNIDLSDVNLLNCELKIPGPADPCWDEEKELKQFYGMMLEGLNTYLKGLAAIEELDSRSRELLLYLVKSLPEKALKRYRELYVDLVAQYPHFAIWVREIEKKRFSNLIVSQGEKAADDHGKLLKTVESIPEIIQEHAVAQMLERLKDYNQKTIDRCIIDSFEMSFQNEIKLPTRRRSFVPQKFSFLRYSRKLSLERDVGWHQGTELIDFIGRTIYNQTWNKKPVLLLGGPGAGKTSLIQMLAGEYLCKHFHVIVVRLRELGNDRKLYENVENQINYCLGKLKKGVSWDQLESSKVKMPVLVIFDGYDELLLASNKEHRQLLLRIEQFQEESDLMVHTVVTSRITLIDNVNIPEGTTVIRLDGFDKAQINDWVKFWNNYHQNYFRKEGLAPLEIPEKENIEELAKQPLLLLMLALYDAMDNSLKKDQDLDQARLYNKLIRRFIGREEKKRDADFEEQYGATEIDREMERLGVTALGMYNRKRVHIHMSQLKQDLDFLKVEPYSDKMKDEERLLRRFFFINSMEQETKDDSTFGAYEFLHNSFGEFLTAHYMISRLHEHLDGAQRVRAWYAAMAYEPLYRRPNVVRMICQWGMASLEGYREKFGDWLWSELARTLRGDLILGLLDASGGFLQDENQKTTDIMIHTSVYACNLICMGALILGGVELNILERAIPGAWERLLRLWQFGLGEEEMVKFAGVFQVVREETPTLVFRESRFEKYGQNNRTDDLYELYSNLRMEPENSLMAVMKGKYLKMDYEGNCKRMREQRLPYILPMTLNNVLNQITGARGDYQSMEKMLDDVATALVEYRHESDVAARTGAYLMLKFFADSNPDIYQQTFEKIVPEVWNDWREAKTDVLRQLITELFLAMPLNILRSMDLSQMMKLFETGEWEYQQGVRTIAHLAADDPYIGHRKQVNGFLKKAAQIGIDVVPDMLFIIEQMSRSKIGSANEPFRAIESCLIALECDSAEKINADRLDMVARLICIVWNIDRRKASGIWDRSWAMVERKHITMREIYRSKPICVEYLCDQMKKADPIARSFQSQRLQELLDLCPEELTLKHISTIREVAERIKDEKLLQKVKLIVL